VFLSEGLRQDVAPRGVGVSVLCPGYVRSNLPWSFTYRTSSRDGPSSRAPGVAVLQAMQRALDPRAVGEIAIDAIEKDRFLVLADRGEVGDVRNWHARISNAIDEFGE